MSSWANWSWLEPLKDCIKSKTDVYGLSRCGFCIDFSSASRARFPRGSAELAYQDKLADMHATLVDKIVEARAGSMALYCHYPKCMAAVHEHEQPVLAKLKEDVASWHSAKKHASLNPITASSEFNSPLMKWTIGYGQATDFEKAAPQLLDMYRGIYSGWCETLTQEKYNRLIRESETVDTANQKLALTRIWNLPLAADLATQAKRTDVPINSQVAMPRDFNMQQWFEPGSARPITMAKLAKREKTGTLKSLIYSAVSESI